MILIQTIKKIKRPKWFKEIVFDLIFYTVSFVSIFTFIFLTMQNRGERSFIIVDPSSQNTTYSLIDNGTEEIISKYVASSRGKYFYEVQSDRAKSLSEKNKVYFKTFEEAKNAGFKPYFGS